MELILEAGACADDPDYARQVVDEVARLQTFAPETLDLLLKVQMYRPETLTTPTAPRYDNTSGPARNQRELFDKGFTYSQWEQVFEYATKAGVTMFASVFDHQAIEAAVDMGMTRLKIASGDITYLNLIEHAVYAVTRVGGDIYVSTGAADYDDLVDITNPLWDGAILMACHLAYPTPIEYANIARVAELRHATNNRYPIGYSDHTEGYREVLPLLIGLGAHCWEKHFTLESGQGGDSDFAVTPVAVEEYIFPEYDKLMKIWGSPNLTPTEAEQPARELARRGLYAKTDIAKGDMLTMGNIAVLRPERGAKPANELAKYLGKRCPKTVKQGDPL